MVLPRSVVFAPEALLSPAELQRIIDDASSSSPSGCTVCLPSGLVFLDHPLVIRPTTSLLGDPCCPLPTTVLLPGPNFVGDTLFVIQDASNNAPSQDIASTAVARISNVELRGGGRTISSLMAIDASGCRIVKLTNVHFRNSSGTALLITRCPALNVRDCYFEAAELGCAVRASAIASGLDIAYSTFALSGDAPALHCAGITMTSPDPLIKFARNVLLPMPNDVYVGYQHDLITFELCSIGNGGAAIVTAFGNYVQASATAIEARPIFSPGGEPLLCAASENISAAFQPGSAVQVYSIQGENITYARTGALCPAFQKTPHVFSLAPWIFQQKFITNDQLNTINTDNHMDPTTIVIYNLVSEKPTYTIKKPLWIRGPCVLRGKGQSVTYMKLAAYPEVLKDVALINVTTVHPVALVGLTLNGAVEPNEYGESSNRVPWLLGVRGGATVRVRSCSFKQCQDACITAHESSVHAERCSFADCCTCIALERCGYSSIMNCNLFGFSGSGIRIDTCDGMACCGCVIGDSEEFMSERAPYGRQLGVAYAGDNLACIISDNVFANVHAAVARAISGTGSMRASCLTNNCIITLRFWPALPLAYDVAQAYNIVERNTQMDQSGQMTLYTAA